MREENRDPDRLAEEEAAAAEASAIGGPAPELDPEPDMPLRPEDRAVVEAGGGVAEGFEQAERDLVGQASHESLGLPPSEAAFTPEQESDRSSAVYGEPDEVDPTEIVEDPDE